MPIQYGSGETGGNASTLDGKTASSTPAPNIIPVTQSNNKLDEGFLPEGTVYVHPETHPANMIVPDATHRFVTDEEKTAWDGKQAALGFTPENAANKGVANGYASLNASGVIPTSQMPLGAKECVVVNDIAERNALAVFEGLRVYVIDATADTTVKTGGADYIYAGTVWIKTSESESLDLVLDWSNIPNKPTSSVNEIDAAVGNTHMHNNKLLLDSYTQTEANLAGAVGKSHEHSNKTLLDSYTQTEAGLAGAVAKSHEHNNSETLSAITAPFTTELKTAYDGYAAALEGKQAALGFTPENPANKGVANGYAGLDASGVIPLTQLPSTAKECVVAVDITARNLIASPFTGLHVLVLDATADTSVAAGGAEYVWNGTSWSKIAELNAIDAVQDWSNLLNKPTSTPAQIDAAVTGTHSHSNKTALDLLGGTTAAPTWNGGAWPAPVVSPWTAAGSITPTVATGFNVTHSVGNAALFAAGRPIKFVPAEGASKYAIITSYTEGVVTIAGAALVASTAYTMYTADFSRVCQVDFRLLDKFSAATAATNLLATKAFTSFEWGRGPAYLVCVRHKVLTADTGANQPRVNMSIAGNKVVTTNSSAGQAVSTTLTNSGVDINETYYKILFGQSVELTCDANATNNDAANLKVTGIFILE